MVQDIPNEIKANILNEVMGRTASAMKVPFKKVRFPPMGGIQQQVTLVSNADFPYDPKIKNARGVMNIGFAMGKENTINGNIADAILNNPAYSRFFKVVKLNDELYKDGLADSKEAEMAKRIMEQTMAQLEEKYDLVPKKIKEQTERARPEETTLSKQPSTPYAKK